MHISNELQLTTITNMLFVELTKQGIPVCEDIDDRDTILLSAAEHLLYYVNVKDTQACLDEIKTYIHDTVQNFPNYFVLGVEYS